MGTPKKADLQAAFLSALADGLPIRKAAAQARAGTTTVYRWRDEDEEFRDAWAAAYERGTDLLEEEAQRRAVDGVDEPKMIGHGENAQLITVRRYSDTLLIFLLKARRPGKFRDNVQVEHTGAGGGPVQLEHRARLTLSDVAAFARTLE